MHITVELEGMADLERLLEIDRLTTDVTHVVRDAAALGVEAAQASHPYTDRTYKLTGDATTELVSADPYNPEFEMVWPVPYAGFVDERNGFAFTPTAIAKAEEALEMGCEVVVDEFVDG